MKPLGKCSLYTFVDSAYLHGNDPASITAQLCEGGADLIQLRAKDWSRDKIEQTALAMLPITRAHGVHLVINDHLDIALKIGAEFCHLGQEDFFDAGFSHLSELPHPAGQKRPLIGLSTHSPDQALRAIRAGADYIAVGPIFPTGTKPSAKPVTLEYVRWAAANVPVPWFAIGGITLDNLPDVLDAGARQICVVSAILNSDDIRAVCASLRSKLG